MSSDFQILSRDVVDEILAYSSDAMSRQMAAGVDGCEPDRSRWLPRLRDADQWAAPALARGHWGGHWHSTTASPHRWSCGCCNSQYHTRIVSLTLCV